ncbi:MAG TPA: glycosyltransferase family 9 protein [Verrucomicrobiota bacterium]|nr:glycosyltransferase family 9 protein [Verrucomicrobiota bacterium]HNT14310.1 glycosyltransferase family 9 protein [Verrucomicrobiota bacterium]
MKILVISLAGIGDTLLATPLIAELRANFPGARIDALTLWPGAKDLLETNPHLDTVYQKNLLHSPKAGAWRFLRELRSRRYDVSINTHPQSRIHYRFIARLIGARERLSHEYDCSGCLDHLLVNQTLPQDYARHTVEQNLDFLRCLGGKPRLAPHRTEVHPTADDERWAGDFFSAHELARFFCLGVHIGSGGTKNLALKRWPLERYRQLFQRLNREQPGIKILLFGGGAELRQHQHLCAATEPRRVVSVETGNLRQAAALLRRCQMFLSVDTALMHLAAAMHTPNQIVIEAPTLNPTNLPYGNPFTVVPNPVSHGRSLEYYRYDGHGIRGTTAELLACMQSVTVDAVWAAVTAALARRG